MSNRQLQFLFRLIKSSRTSALKVSVGLGFRKRIRKHQSK